MILTQDKLKELLDYNCDTGDFFWKPRSKELFPSDKYWKGWNTRYSGSMAGCIGTGFKTSGYRRIKINDKNHAAHRLAWLYVYGEWPHQIDHINHIRHDNRIANLRNVTQAQNCQNASMYSNNKSGVIGVHYHKATKKWAAAINDKGNTIHLGIFASIEKAKAAREMASLKYGFHENHGDIKRL